MGLNCLLALPKFVVKQMETVDWDHGPSLSLRAAVGQ